MTNIPLETFWKLGLLRHFGKKENYYIYSREKKNVVAFSTENASKMIMNEVRFPMRCSATSCCYVSGGDFRAMNRVTGVARCGGPHLLWLSNFCSSSSFREHPLELHSLLG